MICPLVEDSEVLDAKSASQIAEAMQQYFRGTYQVGLLHGQMKDDEKDRIMQDFTKTKNPYTGFNNCCRSWGGCEKCQHDGYL